jgi:hypothetical protein
MIPIYHFLIQNSVRVLIFSGDVDASVPFTGTQYWTSYALMPSLLLVLLLVFLFFATMLVGCDYKTWVHDCKVNYELVWHQN